MKRSLVGQIKVSKSVGYWLLARTRLPGSTLHMGAWAELEQASSMSEPSVTLHSGFLIGVDWLRALSRRVTASAPS